MDYHYPTIVFILLLIILSVGCISLFPSHRCDSDDDCVKLYCGCLRKGEQCNTEPVTSPEPGVCKCVGHVCRFVPIDECRTDMDCVGCSGPKGDFCANVEWVERDPDADKLCKIKKPICECHMMRCRKKQE